MANRKRTAASLSHLIPEVRTNTCICMAQHPRQHISFCLLVKLHPLLSFVSRPSPPAQPRRNQSGWFLWRIDIHQQLATDQRQPFKIQVNLVRWSFRKQPLTHGGPNLRSNYSFMKKTPCILQVFVWGDISDGRDKAHMSKQPVGFSFSTKLTLGKKTWLGRPAALTVGMFVCGNNSVNILRSDGWEGKKSASSNGVVQETCGTESNMLSAMGIFTALIRKLSLLK